MATTDEGRALTDEHRRWQALLGATTGGMGFELAKLIDPTDIRGTVEGWLEQTVAVLATAEIASANNAAKYVQQFRVAELGASKAASMPVVKPKFDLLEADNSVIWAPRMAQSAINEHMDPQAAWEQAVGALVGRMMREALTPGRETIFGSAMAAGSRWRRVSDGNPCSWCAMLVGRGPAYSSEETANGVIYHNSCGCTAEEYFGDRDDWIPTPREKEYVDLVDSVYEPGMTDRQIAAAMREKGQGIINDAHHPDIAASGGGKEPPKPPKSAISGSHPDDDPTWSRQEQAITDYLRGVGYVVTKGGTTPKGRIYDFTLNDLEPADGKTPQPGASSQTMVDRATASVKKGGQARVLIFDMRGTGISEDEKARGIRRIRGLFGASGVHGHKLDRIIVILDESYLEEVL
ncbi:MAG: hypothetical protein FWG47_05045 [Propionibacteriaceae bacterium]|nr:hypothetical protein [Propionibacteriaceae bacterium]